MRRLPDARQGTGPGPPLPKHSRVRCTTAPTRPPQARTGTRSYFSNAQALSVRTRAPASPMAMQIVTKKAVTPAATAAS